MREEMLEGKGGVRIFLRSWQPPGEPRGVVVLVHGFKSHGGQYTWVAEQLAQTGLAVYAPDLRGRGRSEGQRFFIEQFDDYVSDVAMTVELARERQPDLPLFLLGHSAGGVVSCAYTLEHQDDLAGLICESFAYAVPAPDFALKLIKAISRVVPHAPVFKLKNKDFTRDPGALATLDADPLIANEIEPAQTVAELARADEHLEREFPRITLPLLILHGTGDRATEPNGSRYFLEQARSSDKTLRLYEGHYHDLLNDVGKESVLADIRGWIGAHVPASP
jgi:alpha-beta hydrolase superfamily lysophospholipase